MASSIFLRYLVYATTVATVLTVDRSNFKTCEQSGFCKRLRGMEKGNSAYVALLNTVQINATRVSFEVENTRNNVKFIVELVQLADNTVRIRMREAEPLRSRFELPVGDVLVSEPAEDRLSVEKTAETLIVRAANYAAIKYVVTAKPLRIDFYYDDRLVVSANARGLLRFEHTRVKPASGFGGWFAKDDEGVAPSATQQGGGVIQKLGRFAKSWLVEPFRFAVGGHAPEPDAEADVDDDAHDAHANPKDDAAELHHADADGESWNERGERIGADGSIVKNGAEARQDAAQQQQQEQAVQNEADPDRDLPGVGEEDFKGHRDRKPYGPQAIGLDFTFVDFRHVYGIPEHADSLVLRNTKNGDPYRLYNLDVFEYELPNTMALYASIPFMVAHSATQSAGLFWLNPSETWVDVEPLDSSSGLSSLFGSGGTKPQVDTHWMSETGNIDVFLLLGPRPADLFRQYGRLTGNTPLPPLPAIGYHQSRWNYNDEQDCLSVDSQFDEADIPYDVLWLDIEHTDGKRYFTWDKLKFPDPQRLVDALAAKGRRLTTIIDPHIKADSGFSVYTDARDKDMLVKTHDGSNYEGWCWPGTSVYLDFVNPAVRTWWASRFSPSLYEGSSPNLLTWNDMNEPSVFNGPEVTMFKDNKHFGDREHREVHNAYGLYVHMASHLGHLHRSDGQERPFVLTRAAFAGSQRYSAIWTGDNTAEWSHLKISLPMIMSLNLAGMTFSGADIGGFFKNPDAELLTRWYQTAAFTPFFRAHAHIETRRREPYLQAAEYKLAIRDAVRMRAALTPYWYTLFWLSERSGAPLVAPLWVHFPNDSSTFAVEDHMMVGPALLIRPVLDQGAQSVSVYLPHTANDVWYDAATQTTYAGGQTYQFSVNLRTVPVFQRGGTIVPRRERIRRAISLSKNDPVTLWVALDKQSHATGDLYFDDYHTFRYKTHKEYAHVTFTFKNNKLEAKRQSGDAKFTTDAWVERIIIVGLSTNPRGAIVTVNRKGGQKNVAQPSPLDFRYIAESKTVVIRRPGVNVLDDWQIVFSY